MASHNATQVAGRCDFYRHARLPTTANIAQVAINVIFSQLLQLPLACFNQPRVITEVIGGILVGPSAMMRIPGFQETIFPKKTMPVLSNIANLGLVLFLFSVDLELDLCLVASNSKAALSVAVAGIIVPLGFGCAIAWGL